MGAWAWVAVVTTDSPHLMCAYIMLSLLVGVRAEEARARAGITWTCTLTLPFPLMWPCGDRCACTARPRLSGYAQIAVEALRALLESQAHERLRPGEGGRTSQPTSAPPSMQGTSGRCSGGYAKRRASAITGRHVSCGPRS